MSYMGPGTASLANVAGTTSSVTLFPQASHSSGRMIYNDSTALLYVAFGVAAAPGTFSTVVGSASSYTFPVPVYPGQVNGVWASTAGTARTTWW